MLRDNEVIVSSVSLKENICGDNTLEPALDPGLTITEKTFNNVLVDKRGWRTHNRE